MRVTPKGPPYKNEQNVALTKALFHECDMFATHPTYDPVFCLYGEVPGLISCQKTFLEMRDPTGRKWAREYLKDWNHFQKLMKTSYFKEAFDSWVEELKLELRAEALEKVQTLLLSDKENIALAAAKYLAESGWEESAKPKRGRPSKDEVSGEVKRQAQLSKEEQEDLERINFRVVGGTDT